MHPFFSGYVPFYFIYEFIQRQFLFNFMQEKPCNFEAHLIHSENNNNNNNRFLLSVLLSLVLSTNGNGRTTI